MFPSRRAIASSLVVVLMTSQVSAAGTPPVPANVSRSGQRAADDIPRVYVCIAQELIDQFSWERPEAGSRMSDFKEAVAAYIEAVADTRLQYRVPRGAFDAFDPRSTKLQDWIAQVTAGQPCPADTTAYTLPAPNSPEVRASSTAAGDRCNALASVPGDPLGSGAGVPDGKVDVAVALPVCEAAASSRPFNPRYAYLYARVLEEANRLQEAAQYYQAAADAGIAFAADALGTFYYSGRGVPKSDDQAFRYVRQAAESGVWGAMYNLGIFYMSGIGVQQDDDQAIKWFRKSGDAGYAEGYAQVGRIYILTDHPNFPLAAQWFQYAADRNSVMGAENLGYLYESGRGVPQDQATAVAWFRKAAEAGNTHAMRQLGMHLRQGAGVAWSEGEAMQWFQKASDAGDTRAQSQLAFGYMWGLGKDAGQGHQDYGRAAYWYGQAARAGDPVALLDLGVLYANGWGVTQDIEQARAYFSKAASGGMPAIAATAQEYTSQLNAKTAANDDWVGGAIFVGLTALAVYGLTRGSSSSGSGDYAGTVYSDPYADYNTAMNQITHCAMAGGTSSVFDPSICY